MEEMFNQLLHHMKELTGQLQQKNEALKQLREIIAAKAAQIAALTARIQGRTYKKNIRHI